MLHWHERIALVGAVVAAALGVAVGAQCRTADAQAASARLGPRIEMSEATILFQSPYPDQRPPTKPA